VDERARPTDLLPLNVPAVSQRIASGLAALAVSWACAAPAGATAPAPATQAPTATAPAPSATAPPPASPAPPATAPAPPAAHVKLSYKYGFSVDRHVVTVPERVLNIRGDVRPYAPDQWVIVKAYLHGRLFKTATLRLARSSDGRYGSFYQPLSSRGAGRVTVVVSHAATSTLGAFTARSHYWVLNDRVTFGSTGPFVQLVQQRLAALHFYIPQTGVYDQGTGLAIDAFHRSLRWGTSQTLDGATTTWLLNGWGGFTIRFPTHGRHAEGNLSLQLLALANGGRVYAIYPISSGKPSTPTILGNFRVYSKVPGYMTDGMYYSNFFYSGYAIHGYNPAPDYPASHGCMRVPIADAISIYDWLNIGNWVDVYY
jgi:hypothetical protein